LALLLRSARYCGNLPSRIGSAAVKIGHELDFAPVATEIAPSLIGAGIDDKWGGLLLSHQFAASAAMSPAGSRR